MSLSFILFVFYVSVEIASHDAVEVEETCHVGDESSDGKEEPCATYHLTEEVYPSPLDADDGEEDA